MLADAELAAGLEGEDDAAGRRAGDEVDERLAVAAARRAAAKNAAQLARRGRVLEDLELLDVGVAVAAALEQEVALAERPGRAEQRLGPERDGVRAARRRARVGWSSSVEVYAGPPSHGSRPVLDALGRRRAGLRRQRRPDRASRYDVDARAGRHSAASSSTRRTGSVGSAKIAVPTWTATAPTARKSSTSASSVTPPIATTGILTAWAAS